MNEEVEEEQEEGEDEEEEEEEEEEEREEDEEEERKWFSLFPLNVNFSLYPHFSEKKWIPENFPQFFNLSWTFFPGAMDL